MTAEDTHDTRLMKLAEAIAAGDRVTAMAMLTASPDLAQTAFKAGATRQSPEVFLTAIHRHTYAGDTALHIAAAAFDTDMVGVLLGMKADVAARNRRGAQALHSACVGNPESTTWNPAAQAATVTRLIAAGADANAADKQGMTPLHKAVRTRCAAAVAALLEHGAEVDRRGKSGSTALKLATLTTGRGGSGSPEAKAQQTEIIRLLERHGASPS